MEITDFAPVLIPTLNRYEHFKRCLESLERCKWADKTVVYVALDYPPSEKYVEGWKKNDEYLHVKEENNGFKSLIVYRRKENYFFSGKGNLRTAINDLPKEYDTFIFTEDDNEFSPCFLDYTNQNLQKYRDDPFIFTICGYLPKQHIFHTDYSQFFADRYIAWGVGHWKHKFQEYQKYATKDTIIKLVKDKKVRKYFEDDKLEVILSSLVKMSKGGPMLGDVIVASYMVYKGMRNILPTKSMVRNHGWDGSGQHGGFVAGYIEQEICTNADYVMNEAPSSFTKEFEEDMHHSRRSRKRSLNEYASAISWYLYKYTGIFCEFKYLHDLGKYIKNNLHGIK